MHWAFQLGLLWVVIYTASLLTALVVSAFLPVSPFVAVMVGLSVGLLGVLYAAGSYADQRVLAVLHDRFPRDRPTIPVDRDEALGGIVDELRENEQQGSMSKERSK
jgi:hypothetical protein